MRMKPEARKADILAAALKLSERRGYASITRQEVTEAAGVTGPLVNHYFGTMAQLRRDIIRHAIKEENLRVLAQGLVAGDKYARRAPAKLRQRALAVFR